MGQSTENVLFLQCLNERMLKFIRHKVSALGIRTHLQGVQNLVAGHFASHGVPEGFPVFHRGAARLFLAAGRSGLAGDRGIDGLRKLRIQSGLPFQTVDLLAEVHHIGLHLVIGRHILGGQKAVGPALGIQKSLGSFPRLRTFLTQFQNLVHS